MGKPGKFVMLAAFAVFASSSSAWAQDIVSVRSGLIHHIEGAVTLEGKPVRVGNARFPTMAAGEVLEVQRGYAEVLLTPGAFLRLERGASVRLSANTLENTRLELLKGTAMVEIDELEKGNHISVAVGGYNTSLLKNGLYSFDAEAGRLKVFDGKAQVSDGAIPVELGKGRTLLFDPAATKPEKFSTKQSKDSLYAWSQQRAQRIAVANISASRELGGSPVRTSFWAWDPWLSMYTFMPRSGYVSNVFGEYYYNPQTVWVVAQPRVYAGVPAGNSGSSGGSTSAASPAASSPGVSSAPSTSSGAEIRTRASDAAGPPSAPVAQTGAVRHR